MKRYPYIVLLAFFIVATVVSCNKTETKPTDPTPPTTGGGTTNPPAPKPVDTSAPLDPNPINNTTGFYLGSLRVYKFVKTTGGVWIDSSDVTYDSQLKISNPEGKKLLWEADGSIFFSMEFKDYVTNFHDTKEKRQYVVFHAKQRYVDYFYRTEKEDKTLGTITTEGTQGTWYKQSN